MPVANDPAQAPGSSRAPRAGLVLMVVIVAGTALIALYANVQKSRRSQIEKVTITPAAGNPVASPSPAP